MKIKQIRTSIAFMCVLCALAALVASADDPFVAEGSKMVLDFRGGNNSANCVAIDYKPSISNLTASAWVKNCTVGSGGWGGENYGCIVAQGALSGVSPGYACYIVSTDKGMTCSLHYQLRTSQTAIEISTDWTTQSKDDKWHLVTITYDQSTGDCGLYVDAELKGCATYSTSGALSTAPVAIGGRCVNNTGDAQFTVKGCVAEVSLWNRVVSPRELKRQLHGPLSGTEQGLLGYWPLNDNSSDQRVATDCVNNGNPQHPGVLGWQVQVVAGSVDFFPAPGLVFLLR